MISFTTRRFATHSIKSVGVVGAGQMGTGIGIVASRVACLNVTFVDPSGDSLKRSENFITNWCQKEIAKERLTKAESEAVINRISFSTQVESLSKADFIIEAANEDFDLKKHIFSSRSLRLLPQ